MIEGVKHHVAVDRIGVVRLAPRPRTLDYLDSLFLGDNKAGHHFIEVVVVTITK